MNYPELIAVVFGIASVWFARKENILVFPMGIISVLIFIYLFFTGRMYANAGINVIYFFTNAFGWYNWSRKKNSPPSASAPARCASPSAPSTSTSNSSRSNSRSE